MTRTRICAVALVAIISVFPACDSLTDVINEAAGGLPQRWLLVNDAQQSAIVVVTPFTNSGTFSETSDSPGWWSQWPGGQMRIPLSGTVSHTGGNDRWSFTITVQNGSVSLLGGGEGWMDGKYPTAVTAFGHVEGTLRTPGGTQNVTGSWRGYLDNR